MDQGRHANYHQAPPLHPQPQQPLQPTEQAQAEGQHQQDELFHVSDTNLGLVKTAKRQRTGCLTCRRRKVKCGEETPVCAACTRLLLDCVYPDTSGSNSARATRKRATLSCEQCRTAKARCARQRPTCERCSAKGLSCTYQQAQVPFEEDYHDSGALNNNISSMGFAVPLSKPNEHQRAPTFLPPASSTEHRITLPPLKRQLSDVHLHSQPKYTGGDSLHSTPHSAHSDASATTLVFTSDVEQDMASNPAVRTLVDAYFARVYPLAWNGYVHPTRFRKQFTNNQAYKPLLLSMCAAANILVDPSSTESHLWAKNARITILEATEKPTQDSVATLLNLIFIAYYLSIPTLIWSLTGIATRLAYALRMNIEAPEKMFTEAEREERRRLMWACFCWDSVLCNGVPEFTQVPLSAMHIGLPCSENSFKLGLHTKTRRLILPLTSPTAMEQTKDEGLLAQLMTVMALRARVCSYVFNISKAALAPWDPDSVFQECRRDLEVLRGSLRPETVLNEDTLLARQSTGQLSQFMLLHLMLHQCECDLHRISLHGMKESAKIEVLLAAPQGWLADSQITCYQAALRVSEVVHLCVTVCPDYISEDMFGCVCLYESLRIQIWGFANLITDEERDAVQLAALPRFDSAIRTLLQARFKEAARLITMVTKLLHNTFFQFLLDSTPGRAATPEEDSDTYPSRATQGKHDVITRIHRELALLDEKAESGRAQQSDPSPAESSNSRSTGLTPNSLNSWMPPIPSQIPLATHPSHPLLEHPHHTFQPSLDMNLSTDYLLDWNWFEGHQ